MLPSYIPLVLLRVYTFILLATTALGSDSKWINYPDEGSATMTHYTIPQGYVAACGCTGDSTKYPTAALSQMAYGSATSFGPACGRCFKLTLGSPLVATPPFHPTVLKSIVVKITDLCPLSTAGWCSGTTQKTNSAGSYLNFDLAYPSAAIPDDFFPSDEALYGYKDFGVWNITYQSVSCVSNWEGGKNAAALGSVKALGSGGCCPAEPQVGNSSNICPSFSDQAGIPPDTRTNAAVALSSLPWLLVIAVVIGSFPIL